MSIARYAGVAILCLMVTFGNAISVTDSDFMYRFVNPNLTSSPNSLRSSSSRAARGGGYDDFDTFDGHLDDGWTNGQPSTTKRIMPDQSGVNVWTCYPSLRNPGEVYCSETVDFDLFYNGHRALKAVTQYCPVAITGGISIAASDGTKANTDSWLYMYGRFSNHQMMIQHWSEPGYYATAKCADAYPMFDAHYVHPSALYIELGPGNSYVLVVSINWDGYLLFLKDYRSSQSQQKLIQPSNGGNRPRTHAGDYVGPISLVRDNDKSNVHAFYIQWTQSDLMRTTYNIDDGSWSTPIQIQAAVNHPITPFPFVVRFASTIRPVNPKLILMNLNINMWPKHGETIVTESAMNIGMTSWYEYNTDSNEPSSSCSEMLSYRVDRWTELWTVCFYRGYNDDWIWYTGYKFPIYY